MFVGIGHLGRHHFALHRRRRKQHHHKITRRDLAVDLLGPGDANGQALVDKDLVAGLLQRRAQSHSQGFIGIGVAFIADEDLRPPA